MIIVLCHTSPKNVLCARLVEGVDVEPSLICDLSQFVLKQVLLE